MRLLAALLLSALGTCSSFAAPFDAKQDCIKALNNAKAAGLPISPADLTSLKPTTESKKLEALISKADKIFRRNQPSLDKQVDLDIENLKRKKQGKSEIELKSETAQQKTSRIDDVLAVIREIGNTRGSRIVVKNYDSIGGFASGMSIKNLLNLQLEDVEKSAKAGKAEEVKSKLKTARRLVEISRSDSLMVSLLVQQAAEAKYYACIEKVITTYPSASKGVGPELVSSFGRPTIARILQEEFLQTIALSMNTSGKSASWSLPKDPKSLPYLTRSANSWVIDYKVLKDSKTGADLEKRYKAIAPKLDVYKFGEDNDELVLGPGWAEKGSVLDRGEVKRLAALKLLSSKR